MLDTKISLLAVAIASIALATSAEAQRVGVDIDEMQREGITRYAQPDGRAGFGFYEPPAVECLTKGERAWISQVIEWNRVQLTQAGLLPEIVREPVQLEWPLRQADTLTDTYGVHGVSNFVDLDPAAPGALLDYRCLGRSYDLSSGYNHQGIDYFTWPFAWKWMDEDAVEVVAAAPGVIAFRSDGFDDESCGLSGGDWNAVYLFQLDGSVAFYGHLKKNSLTPKTVGQWVQAGEYLGVIGSSGNSTGPHLHLEFQTSTKILEPHTGPCNPLAEGVVWKNQRPYYDSAINLLLVGSAPVSFPACPGRATTNEALTVPRGTTAYFTVFYRDQLGFQNTQYRLLRPNGTTFNSWSHSSGFPHYYASWWWWTRFIPAGAPTGTWTFEAVYDGVTYTQTFEVS